MYYSPLSFYDDMRGSLIEQNKLKEVYLECCKKRGLDPYPIKSLTAKNTLKFKNVRLCLIDGRMVYKI